MGEFAANGKPYEGSTSVRSDLPKKGRAQALFLFAESRAKRCIADRSGEGLVPYTSSRDNNLAGLKRIEENWPEPSPRLAGPALTVSG